MKLVVLLVITVGVVIYLTTLNNTDLSGSQSFISFYKSLPAQNFKFKLYEGKNNPISEYAIKTLDGSYNDLVELGKDSKYKIKIFQIQHEDAMSQLEQLYMNVSKMNLCSATIGQSMYKLCNKNKEKGRNLYDYIKEQVYQNAKSPYQNAREYFYLNFKTIINEKSGI